MNPALKSLIMVKLIHEVAHHFTRPLIDLLYDLYDEQTRKKTPQTARW